MTINELIDRLEDAKSVAGGEATVYCGKSLAGETVYATVADVLISADANGACVDIETTDITAAALACCTHH